MALNIWASFLRKAVAQELSKFAQSGHTAGGSKGGHLILMYSAKKDLIFYSNCLRRHCAFWDMNRVTRLGDLLDFRRVLKAFGNINLPKSPTFLGNFCKGVIIFHFSSEIIFGQLLQTFGDFFLVTLLPSENYSRRSCCKQCNNCAALVLVTPVKAMRVKVLYPLLMNNSLVKSSWTCKCCLAQDRDYVLNISRIDQKWTPSLQFIHVQVNVYKYAFTTCIITNKRLQIRIYKLHIYKLHIYKCII